MKNIFKFLAIFAIIGTIVIIGCKEDDPPPPPPVIGISLNKVTLELIKGNQETLTATVTNTSNTAVTWSSSDTTKVTVADGVVTAVVTGAATITATTVDGGKTATCTVTVPDITISLNKVTLELIKGKTETLTATVTNTDTDTVKWSSANTAIATVDENTGLVTAVNYGTTIITATTVDGGKTATCTVTVPDITISLNKTAIGLIAGETETLTKTVKNTDNQTVTWSSANTAVATVNSSSGLVTAVSSGITEIIATTVDGGKTAQCAITVYPADMVRIAGGTFSMGQTSIATPVHSVTLTSGFYMGKYQVTQEQYQAVIGSNPSRFSSNPQTGETQGKRPVEQVSWYDALVFCNKLSIKEGLTPAYSISGKTNPADWGTVPTSSNATWNAVVIVSGSTGYRLPTEAQWEYACRAGTTTAYNTGDTISDNTGWYSSNSGDKTHEVGLKSVNAWGLYDMHGNVYEWCWDWYGSYSTGAQTDPLGASSGTFRVLRGGGWNISADGMRSAVRSNNDPYDGYFSLGFRLVRP
jgi:formylglycine-generating enzyme